MKNAARAAKKLRGNVGMERFSPASPHTQAQTQLTCKLQVPTHGTLGRGVTDCVVTVTVAVFKPSAVAVSFISPASLVDCTMICARPLNRLRDHGEAWGWPVISTFTS